VAAQGGQSGPVTVALLTRDAGDLLGRVLAGIARQRTERSVELLAVDSGSTDGTVERLESAGARVIAYGDGPFDFGVARELAYAHARGKFVVNLSQDAVPMHETWLENLLVPLRQGDVAVSCGGSVPDPERPVRQFPWERNGFFYFTREMQMFRLKHGRGASFSNSAVLRNVWEQLRFDPAPLGEDFQFQIKAQAAGYRVAFVDDAPALHHHDYDLRGLWGRCRNEGLALRKMGCAYGAADLARDLASPVAYVQWARELVHGRLRSPAAALFPVVRPVAVYAGSRFGKAYRPYRHRMKEAA